MAAAAPDRDPVLAVLVQQVQDLFGGVSGELLDVPRGQLDVKVRGAPEPRGDAGRGGEAAGDAAGSVPPRDPAAVQQRGDLRVAVKGGQPRSTCRGGSPPRRSGMPWSSRVRSTVLTVLSRCARCGDLHRRSWYSSRSSTASSRCRCCRLVRGVAVIPASTNQPRTTGPEVGSGAPEQGCVPAWCTAGPAPAAGGGWAPGGAARSAAGAPQVPGGGW